MVKDDIFFSTEIFEEMKLEYVGVPSHFENIIQLFFMIFEDPFSCRRRGLEM